MPCADRRPRRSTAVKALPGAALLGLVLTLTAACSEAGPDSSAHPSAPSAVPGTVPGTAVAYGLPADLTPMLLPAVGSETRLTQGLDGFASLVRDRATRACLSAARVRMPDAPPAMFIRLFEIPDLDHISRQGFSPAAVPGAAPSGPATGATGAADSADSADSADPSDLAEQRRCGKEGEAAAGALQSLYAPLQSRWLTGLGAVEKEASVVAARQGFSDCLAGRAIRADNEQVFFDQVDRILQTADGPAAASAEDHRLGAAYAACMRPVEAAREPLRVTLRAGFVREHEAELEAARKALPERIAELERRYSVRFGVPTED
ncbi:hypothetical protein ACFVHB_33825 [Kitasatospora sp. NPDC127111]|uniref:hypothetical protein n=1 Tax=Kitasatospora sp. NPDC127111 TaxID=3345363 RepID=UPI003628E6AC